MKKFTNKNFTNKRIWKTVDNHGMHLSNKSYKVNSLYDKFLWILIFLLSSIVVYSSMYFDFFIKSKSLTTCFIILSFLLLLIIAKFTIQGTKSWNFLLDAKFEMFKIVWPTKQELVNSTIIVLLILIFSSLLIYMIGVIFMKFIHWLLI